MQTLQLFFKRSLFTVKTLNPNSADCIIKKNVINNCQLHCIVIFSGQLVANLGNEILTTVKYIHTTQ